MYAIGRIVRGDSLDRMSCPATGAPTRASNRTNAAIAQSVFRDPIT